MVFQSEWGPRWTKVRFDVIGVMARPGEKLELSHIVAAF